MKPSVVFSMNSSLRLAPSESYASSVRFHDMFSKACKQFDYNDVLELSSVVDTEYRTFKNAVYYAWYMHRKSA